MNASHNAIRLLYAGIAVILLCAAYLIGYQNGKTGNVFDLGSTLTGNRYEAGYEAAHQKLIESKLIPSQPEKITSLSGRIISIDQNKIQIEVPQVILDPLSEPAPTNRDIKNFDAATVLVRVQKTPDQLAKDIKDMNKLASRGKTPSNDLLSPFTEKTGAIGDLKAGDLITVEGAAGIDLTYATEITAPSKITKNATSK
jgi:hypothetical protein